MVQQLTKHTTLRAKPSSGPRNHIRQFKTACNSNSMYCWHLWPLEAHVYTYSCPDKHTWVNTHIQRCLNHVRLLCIRKKQEAWVPWPLFKSCVLQRAPKCKSPQKYLWDNEFQVKRAWCILNTPQMWMGWVQRRSSTELGWELLLHNEAICFLMGCSTTLKGRKDCLFIQQAGT